MLLVAEAGRWNDDDEAALAAAIESKRPVVLVLNKVDLVADKGELLPKLAELSRRHAFAAVVPISARRRRGSTASPPSSRGCCRSRGRCTTSTT